MLSGKGVVRAAIVAIVLQAIASGLILMDAVLDVTPIAAGLHAAYHRFELLNAALLLLALVLATVVVIRLVREAKRREAVVKLASGALAELVETRFGEWNLTASETEVALFSLKGFEIAEIARIRHSATGTVRAQLSRVYEKAGVSSQAMLISSMIDEFLDVVPAPEALAATGK